MVLSVVLGFFALLSGGLSLWQWGAAWRFPLHLRLPRSEYTPAITLLKPLKGVENATTECLESWMTQNYPGKIQILFGVASETDPVGAVARDLMRKHSQCDAQLIICDPSLGANAKVSSLIQLERSAKHECVVISDADVMAPPDLLASLVQPLAHAKTGLVNCFYSLACPATGAMQWEAIAINADFWSQVCQSRTLFPLDFALGAVMATTRAWLRKMGGFDALKDYLADDYRLGNLIARQEGRIEISTIPVACHSSPMSWKAVWKHQLRWAITIRHCKPLPYFFSILSNGTLWPLLWLAVNFNRMTMGIVAALVLTRVAAAAALQARLTQSRSHWPWCWLAPVKDLLQFALWLISLFGRHVEWRGQRHRLEAGGRIARDPVDRGR